MTNKNGSYLGRYQQGDHVPLRVWTIDWSTCSPVTPPKAPWLRVFNANGDLAAFIPRMPTEDFWGITGLFRHSLRLDGSFEPGVYAAIYTYRTQIGNTYMLRDQFEVIGGSDGSGTLISMYSVRHPETNYVLAQLNSGRLVMGRNPRV